MKGSKGKHAWTAKVGEKGQIVIPREARELFDIHPGDTVLLLGDEKKGLLLQKEICLPDYFHKFWVHKKWRKKAMAAIQTINLTKTYKTETAVNALNLTVLEGELFSLLGMNGAGKTTTIKMLSCILAPTSGDAVLLGDS